MDFQYIIDRSKGIILEPKKEWEQIKGEQRSEWDLILFYALPLVALSVITGLIGTWSVRWAIYQLIMPIVSIVIASYVVNELAEKFNSAKNLNNAFKLVVYASTPSLLAAIIANLSLLLSWVGLFGLYSIYLFWIGISEMMETPDDKRLTYVLISALVLIVIQFLLSLFIAPQMISPYI